MPTILIEHNLPSFKDTCRMQHMVIVPLEAVVMMPVISPTPMAGHRDLLQVSQIMFLASAFSTGLVQLGNCSSIRGFEESRRRFVTSLGECQASWQLGGCGYTLQFTAPGHTTGQITLPPLDRTFPTHYH